MLHHTNLQFKEELIPRKKGASYIVLHHSRVVSRHTVKDVHQWHLNKEWAGIGYHFFIDKKGEIYEGRPLWAKGAHAKEFNAVSIGLCFEGDFNKEMMNPTQEDAAVMLIALLALANEGASIVKHRDLVKDRTCPGKHFPFERLKEKVETCKRYLENLFGKENFDYSQILRLFNEIRG